MILASFLAALGLFLAVGLASGRKAKHSRTDYYLADRSVRPWLVGLSAVATNNSGYMFIGVIGYTYVAGLASIWLMIGWIVGDFLASLFIHHRLRQAAGESKEASFAAVLANWGGEKFIAWRRIAAMLMILFLGAYAAAQLSAGGKALQGVLNWHPDIGAIVVAAMVLLYSTIGGIRASIWTDALQAMVMIVAMSILALMAINTFGGVEPVMSAWSQLPGFLDLYPDNMIAPGIGGLVLFAIGWMFAGFSVVGQPHVMIRFMTLDEPANMTKARVWYYSYFTAFYALATIVGMMSRLYLPELQALDPELALPTMAVELLPAVLVGIVLAGIFAATMSTADSLILSCSAAITHDLVPSRLESSWLLKAATAAVTLLALAIALSDNSSVFALVILAWSTLACAFAPLLTLYALNRRVSERAAIVMMMAGVGVALIWRMIGWHDAIYEGLPGILVGLSIGWAASVPRPQS